MRRTGPATRYRKWTCSGVSTSTVLSSATRFSRRRPLYKESGPRGRAVAAGACRLRPSFRAPRRATAARLLLLAVLGRLLRLGRGLLFVARRRRCRFVAGSGRGRFFLGALLLGGGFFGLPLVLGVLDLFLRGFLA